MSRSLSVALDSIRKGWRVSRQHRAALKLMERWPEQEKKLNLGCGQNYKYLWINIDLFRRRVDLRLDLREAWPFEDNSIAHVYSEHLLEHFDVHAEVPHFLSEAIRVLKPGGVFDVGVPDTEWPLRAYGNPADPYWSFATTVHPTWCTTQLHHINYHFRQNMRHKYAWDYATLSLALRRARFTNIDRRGFDPDLDSESRRIGTLYLRATKPCRTDSH